jgi:putative MFS transporter
MLIRLFVGFAFGFGQPAWTALCTEITPSDSRILMNALGQSLFSVGEIYSACLVLSQDPYMVQLNWRKLLAFGAVPSLFLFLISFRLHESPSYLALHDKYDDARSNLKQMALDNGLVPTDADFHFQPPTVVKEKDSMVKMWRTFGILAGERMLFSTFVMVYSCLVMNVLFYGCLYAFPQIVTDVEMAQSPAMSLVVGSLWGLPGYLMAYLCSEFFERKPCIMIFFILMIAALGCFNTGGHMHQDTPDYLPAFLTNFGFMGIKLFTPIGFVCIYQYVSEIYPTSARATGTALCLAGGRMGGMLAPLLFEESQRISGDWSLFFELMMVLVAIDFVLVGLLPYRCVKRLEDHEPGDALYTEPSPVASVDK